MSNILAALGPAELNRLDRVMARRCEHRHSHTALVVGVVPCGAVFGEPSGAPGMLPAAAGGSRRSSLMSHQWYSRPVTSLRLRPPPT